MIVWRIAPKEFSADVLDGQGTVYGPGRWHEKGTPLVYVASTLSLAQLEVFMHLGPEGQDIDYVRAEIEIPPKMTIDVIPPANLPSDWNASPAPWTTKNYGMQWIRSRTAAVLKVPAVVSPSEFNYILNPAHRKFHKIKIVSIVPHRFDGRMWKDSAVKTK